MAKKITIPKIVEVLIHDEVKRINIPTAEHESVINQNDKKNIKIKYPRNTDLDPQLVWRGKDEQDWSDLVVNAPPLYIQEKVHPKALIDDLLRQSKEDEHEAGIIAADLFADFDGISKEVDKTEFYSHEQNWSNRMILGDSLQVMASLAEREGLRGQVQCIYFDPPYGIKFNSNFQWSTTSKNVSDGKVDHITREPEQVKAFRDTWRDGIHSYLTYIRDRLTVMRDLLTESGSIFVQISDDNLHRVRSVMDEVFGDENHCGTIAFQKSGGSSSSKVEVVTDYLIWFCKDATKVKIRNLLSDKNDGKNFERDYSFVSSEDGVSYRKITSADKTNPSFFSGKVKRFRVAPCNSQDAGPRTVEVNIYGKKLHPGSNRHWSISPDRLTLISKATSRLIVLGNSLMYKLFVEDAPGDPLRNIWMDTSMAGLTTDKLYVVQTSPKVVQRCILMTTDPGDLVLDPTCGSGTSAMVSEQWGRRWITIDTSRVALALSRFRIMGNKYPFYLLADSKDGQIKEAEITRKAPSTNATFNDLRCGFVYDRVPHVTLKAIADNLELDEIWSKFSDDLEQSRIALNKSVGQNYEDWTIPRLPIDSWSEEAKKHHGFYWLNKLKLFEEAELSIGTRAEFVQLFDKPYEDKRKVRVAGPFTVESLSPHRALGVDEDDNLIDGLINTEDIPKQSFTQMILDNLKTSGVQQAHKEDKIEFSFLAPWPGDLVCAEGKYFEGADVNGDEKRAAIFIGPEFGTVQKADLVRSAREAGDAGFDVLIACAFNYDAHATELNNLGRIPILKARMNADLHMSEDLKNTGKGNLFVIFGEPDIDVIHEANEVDVFKPQTGEVVSDGADGIACWFIDTDYNEESFFVRQAYFLGANDPYSSLKTTLKSEINQDAWATLNSDISRAFPKPKSGRIAVKVINHLGDEVMKVFKV